MRVTPITFLLLLVACNSSTTVTRTARFATQPPDKVDILFVVDNTASSVVREPLAPLLSLLVGSALPVSYHVGVITSDNGANGLENPQCQPGSDQFGGGRLQARGEAANATCLAPLGANYLEIDRRTDTTNLPDGQTVETTLGCMLDVGALGCGFEQPLETSYRALTDTTISENTGFLRDDALLAILYVMDEDDCSAPPTSDVYDPEPSTPPPDGLGLLNSYRCAKWAIVCRDPVTGQTSLMPYAAVTGLEDCRPASQVQGNRLHNVDRYIDLFTRPKSEGGLKRDPDDVMLFAIAGDPPATLSTRLVSQPQAAIVLEPACQSADDPQVFADPAVRLTTVVRAAKSHAVHSICQTDYAPIFQALTNQLATRTEAVRCLPYAVDNLKKCEASESSCIIGKLVRSLAACDAIATNRPCWRLGTDARCDRVEGDPTLIIERDDPPAPDTDYVLRCVD